MYIQMVTALVLQLIQCVVHLPSDKDVFEEYDTKVGAQADKPIQTSANIVLFNTTCSQTHHLLKIFFFFLFQVDQDVLITNSYETAMRTAQNFLSVFLKK